MNKADIILKSNTIFDAIADRPFKGAIAVKGNQILKVIKGGDLSPYIDPTTKVYDFGDKLVMPGFVDAHVHFFLGAVAASSHVCTDIKYSTSEEHCVQIMKDYAQKHPNEKRLLGIGWYPANWNDAPLPTKMMLDEAFPDKPVYLMCADGHSVWTNSKGLQECDITKDTQVSIGEIPLGEDGEPNGMLIEVEAMLPAEEKLYDFPEDTLREVNLSMLKELSESGITSVSNIDAYQLNDKLYKLYRSLSALEKENALNVRMHLYSTLMSNDNLLQEKHAEIEFASDKVRYSGLKAYIDGVTSYYTAFLLEPYSDKPDTVGYANATKAEYQRLINSANASGFGVRLHCIGDCAVRWALDMFEESNRVNHNPGNEKGLLNTIEHIESIHADDIDRFVELGVIFSVQPYHLTLDSNEKITRIGAERSKYEWPFKSLLNTGATMAIGTDYPVIDFDPFCSIYSAISRCGDDGQQTGINPDEKLTLTDVLRGYTFGAAAAYGREKEIGSLEEGKLADIIVINRDLFQIDPLEIKDCQVDMTIFDGVIVHEKLSV